MSEEKPSSRAEFFKMFPSLLWVVFAMCAFLYLHEPIYDFTLSVAARIKAGAQAEIGPLKLEAIKISPEGENAPTSSITISVDKSLPSLKDKRADIYKKNQNYFVAHRLYPSKEAGQTYDIWIYLVPHKKNLEDVKSASYYFGDSAWKNKLFTSDDRGKSFGIVVSAYGPMLAYVIIELKNGDKIETWSYIDFENGSLGSRGGV